MVLILLYDNLLIQNLCTPESATGASKENSTKTIKSNSHTLSLLPLMMKVNKTETLYFNKCIRGKAGQRVEAGFNCFCGILLCGHVCRLLQSYKVGFFSTKRVKQSCYVVT